MLGGCRDAGSGPRDAERWDVGMLPEMRGCWTGCGVGTGARPSPRSPYLRLGEAEGRGQLHPLGSGQVPLDLKPLLQAGELRVGEHGAGFAAAAMLPGQLGVSVVLEQRWHRHSWGDTRCARAGSRQRGKPPGTLLSLRLF